MDDSLPVASMETFWRMLAHGLCAGETLVGVLKRISQEMEGSQLEDVARRMLVDVEGGMLLSQAMRRHPDVFREHVLLLTEGGERAGILDRVLLLILEHAWRCPECILGQEC